ncbi:MAG: hypothetical protein ACI9P5_004741 [Saprospiraceae bacterium]|jgi:hypothetical protein
MKLKIRVVTMLLFIFFSAKICFSQQLEIEKMYEFPSVNANSYLGNVDYDASSKTTTLLYVSKKPTKVLFNKYIFDEQLNFVENKTETYGMLDMLKDDFMSLYSWFSYKGEAYSTESILLYRNFKQEILVKKITYNYKWSWILGGYTRSIILGEKATINAVNERVYLYDRIDNSITGDVIAITGQRKPKGDKDKSKKFQEARKFQFIKVRSDLSSEVVEELSFDYNMGISFIKTITNQEMVEESTDSDGLFSEMSNKASGDFAYGDVVIVFSPVKSMLAGKAYTDPNAGNQVMITLGADGLIKSRIDLKVPTSGWVIEDFILSDNGEDVYFYGPAKDGAYVSSVQPVNTSLGGKTAVKDIKYKNFQLLKVTNGEMAWIQSTAIGDFKGKAVNPPSQNKSPDYVGKNFSKYFAMVTPGGEVIIAGQKYTTKNVSDPNGSTPDAKMKVIDNYKHLVVFHFSVEGDLKAQYGVVRDKNNKYSKAMLTPQYAYCNSDGTALYWVYGEIKGMRKGLELSSDILGMQGGVSISKKKLLFYPTVAKIDLANSTITDFESFGKEGDKQVYYTNPEYPQLLSPDKKSLTFVGENKSGKVLWLGRFNIE